MYGVLPTPIFNLVDRNWGVKGNQPPKHPYGCPFFVPDGTMQTNVRTENTDVRKVGFHPPIAIKSILLNIILSIFAKLHIVHYPHYSNQIYEMPSIYYYFTFWLFYLFVKIMSLSHLTQLMHFRNDKIATNWNKNILKASHRFDYSNKDTAQYEVWWIWRHDVQQNWINCDTQWKWQYQHSVLLSWLSRFLMLCCSVAFFNVMLSVAFFMLCCSVAFFDVMLGVVAPFLPVWFQSNLKII